VFEREFEIDHVVGHANSSPQRQFSLPVHPATEGLLRSIGSRPVLWSADEQSTWVRVVC
jgi:hypothetical protein